MEIVVYRVSIKYLRCIRVRTSVEEEGICDSPIEENASAMRLGARETERGRADGEWSRERERGA